MSYPVNRALATKLKQSLPGLSRRPVRLGDFWSDVSTALTNVGQTVSEVGQIFNPNATGVNPSYNPANPQLPGPFNPGYTVTVPSQVTVQTPWILYGALGIAAVLLLRSRR